MHRLRALLVIFSLSLIALADVSQTAQAQTFTVLHAFTGGQDGAQPFGGVTRDAAGNLYGTTFGGGIGYGTAFRLQHQGSGWTFLLLYTFDLFVSGGNPNMVVVGPNGSIYGTTPTAAFGNLGYAFKLTPSRTAPESVLGPWNITELYQFGVNGYPSGNLAFDQSGNLYGTTAGGGPSPGSVYVLTPSSDGWTLTNICLFMSSTDDGVNPVGGVIMDGSGNLYGTTIQGGTHNDGIAFELVHSEDGWREKILHSFQSGSDGRLPVASLTLDRSGNLYGTTTYGGLNNTGTVFQLVPAGNGVWSFNVIYNFGAADSGTESDVIPDSAGNLFGTTYQGGSYGAGSVFKLIPNGGSWTYVDVHDFAASDGAQPSGNLLFDPNGNLFGTTGAGGTNDNGVVWELTP